MYSSLDVKGGGRASPPSVEGARPGVCPSCGAARRPVGAALGLHGHGLRDRQLRGPPDADAVSTTMVLACRRYRCTACAEVISVPRGVARRRHYGHAAIAMALALWALAGSRPPAVRRRVCAWPLTGAAATGWPTLWRWATVARR